MTTIRPPTRPRRPAGPPRTPRTAGFSLIEVLMAMGILAVGVIAIGTLFPVGVLQQRRTADDSLGNIAGQNALALIQSKDFNFPTTTGLTLFNREAATGNIYVGSTIIPMADRLWPQEGDARFAWHAAYDKPDVDGPTTIVVFVYSAATDPNVDFTAANDTLGSAAITSGQIIVSRSAPPAGSPGNVYRVIRDSAAVTEDKIAGGYIGDDGDATNFQYFPANARPVAVVVGLIDD